MLSFYFAFAFVFAFMLALREKERLITDNNCYFSGEIFGGKKGPSQADIIAAQEDAAKTERERLATETAEKEADAQAKTQATIADIESKRKAFASGALEQDEEEEAARRKFLKGV